MTVTRIASGMYRIEHDGRNDIVYVAGSASDRWIFWNGHVFREAEFSVRPESSRGMPSGRPTGPKADPTTRTSLTAPMPARVGKILTQPGNPVKKGDTVVVLEAMKMELPVRAPADATVTAVCCREGDLVQADAVLIELT